MYKKKMNEQQICNTYSNDKPLNDMLLTLDRHVQTEYGGV